MTGSQKNSPPQDEETMKKTKQKAGVPSEGRMMTPNEKKDALIEKLKNKLYEYKLKVAARDEMIKTGEEALSSIKEESEEELKRAKVLHLTLALILILTLERTERRLRSP